LKLFDFFFIVAEFLSMDNFMAQVLFINHLIYFIEKWPFKDCIEGQIHLNHHKCLPESAIFRISSNGDCISMTLTCYPFIPIEIVFIRANLKGSLPIYSTIFSREYVHHACIIYKHPLCS